MRARLLLEWLMVAVTALGLVTVVVVGRFSERANNVFYDRLATWDDAAAPNDIVIVAIDEASLGAIGRWPWPRSVHAQLIERLAQAHPAAIGYDVLFTEPSPDDAQLAQAARVAGNLVLPITFTVPGSNGAAFDPQLPVPVIAPAARATGHAVLAPGLDGIVRGVALQAGDAKQAWPHIGEMLYRTAKGHSSPAFDRLSGGALPKDQFTLSAPALTRFLGPAGTFPTVSLINVLRGEVPDDFFRGHIVLVGSTESGGSDRYPVPLGIMPGVEVLANITSGVFADNFIRPASTPGTLAFNLVPVAFMLLALIFFSPRVNLAVGLVVIAILLGASALLRHHGIWVPPVPGLLGIAVVYPLWAWRRLAAANFYMSRELSLLRAEPDPLPRSPEKEGRGWFRESTETQAQLLGLAITRLRDLRTFFADSIDGLPDPTLIVGDDGMVVLGNHAATTLFRPVLDAGTVISAMSLTELIKRLTASETALIENEDQEFVTPDGETFILRLAPLLSAQGARLGSIARLTRITAIRVAVRQREDALQLLTHDMRSPQASILAVLDLPWEDDAAAKARIAVYAGQTLKLAEDFVQLARAETVTYAQDLLDLSEILTEAVDDQWALARQSGITLNFEGGPEYLVIGDRTLLRRVFVNLIGNALKYSAAGSSVRCLLEARNCSGPMMVGCSIADQGRGIPADQLARIFVRFGRVNDANSNVGGAGLGLSFVATVVSRHGGQIKCESVPDEGSTFTVFLPLQEPPAEL